MTSHHEEPGVSILAGVFGSCEADVGLADSTALGNGFDIAPAAFNTAEACTSKGDRGHKQSKNISAS